MTKTQVATHLYKTRIDMPEGTRTKSIELLNTTMAAALDIWTQAKQAHWNVKGINFYQLHLLFDDVAGVLYEHIDDIAERITAIGGVAHGTVREAASKTFLPEYPNTERMTEEDHINALADRLAAYAKHVREAIDKSDEWDDKDTADLYTAVSRDVDKKLWFVESHLQTHK